MDASTETKTREMRRSARKVPAPLKRDEIGMNRHRALALCLGMIFSENRCALFRIMPWLTNRAGCNSAHLILIGNASRPRRKPCRRLLLS